MTQIDINQILRLAQDPQVQSLLKGLLGNLTKGGGAPNLNGLLEQFNSQGMGSQVRSWVRTGENQQITPEQLRQALGSTELDRVAAQAGTTPAEAATSLSSVLPQLVDTATPDGQLPDAQSLQDLLAQLTGGVKPPA